MGQEFACQSPLGDQEMIPIFIQLELAQARMLLEMFSIIEQEHGLAGDMLALYNRLKEQIPE